MSNPRCPTCGKVVHSSKAHRPVEFPFCSERCRLIDLGKWLNGDYRISTPIESPEQVEKLLREQEQAERAEPDEDNEG